MDQPRLFALLIGIEGYLPNTRSGGVDFPPLSGCGNDVRAAERFLTTRLGVPAERIETLLAPVLEPVALDPATLPTYENVVAAWRRLGERAAPGDQVFIFYSGHGGRAATTQPAVKGPDGLDKCLVPFDIGQSPEPRYLRDTEVSILLAELVARGVFATVVLDCCYSGGAAREEVRVRGVEAIDRSELAPSPVLGSARDVAPLMPGTARRRPVLRGLRSDPGADGPVEGYVLFAACRPHEPALEARFGGVARGALSYWFFRLLESAEPGLTCRRLYQRVLSQVLAQFQFQTPQIEGETDGWVFGREQGARPVGMPVSAVRGEPPEQIEVRAGQAQGLQVGARLAVLAPEGPCLGMAEVSAVGAATASAALMELEPGTRAPRAGDEAVLLDPGPLRRRRPLRWLVEPEARLAGGGAAATELLARVHAQTGGLLDPQGEGDELDGFCLSLAADGTLEIGDGAGRPWPRLGPSLNIQEPNAGARLARRLEHLARFRDLLGLFNWSSPALRGGLVVTIGRAPGDAQSHRGSPRRTGEGSNMPGESMSRLSVTAGERVVLAVENRSRHALNLAVLDLAPDWSAQQVWPARSRGDFDSLEPSRRRLIPLVASLPPGLERGPDVLKVFATRDPLDLRALELPALDRALPAERVLRGSRPLRDASLDWWVEQVEVEVTAQQSPGLRV